MFVFNNSQALPEPVANALIAINQIRPTFLQNLDKILSATKYVARIWNVSDAEVMSSYVNHYFHANIQNMLHGYRDNFDWPRGSWQARYNFMIQADRTLGLAILQIGVTLDSYFKLYTAHCNHDPTLPVLSTELDGALSEFDFSSSVITHRYELQCQRLLKSSMLSFINAALLRPSHVRAVVEMMTMVVDQPRLDDLKTFLSQLPSVLRQWYQDVDVLASMPAAMSDLPDCALLILFGVLPPLQQLQEHRVALDTPFWNRLLENRGSERQKIRVPLWLHSDEAADNRIDVGEWILKFCLQRMPERVASLNAELAAV